MLRHALAHLLHAIAECIEPEAPEPEVKYVYVYSTPPATTWPTNPIQPQWWSGGSGNGTTVAY